MLKVIAISVLFMILGCIIIDKFENFMSGRNVEGNSKRENSMDKETLKILSDYGLINEESYKVGSNGLNKA